MRKTLTAAILAGFAFFTVHAQDGPYKFIKEIPVGGEGGWDYLSVDPAAHHLYVSHATVAVVIDTQKDAVIGTIADTPGIHGAIAATPGRVLTSNGRGNNASIVDTKTWKTISSGSVGCAVKLILGPQSASVAANRSIRSKNSEFFEITSIADNAGASCARTLAAICSGLAAFFLAFLIERFT